ncbi:unnamed protein product [Fraxinus pennsylvanica]|uniref:Reticulon-like protein n=1 Tax=Fraxinus pennsylvanica TaxID=56036 RepID=A0AAD2A7S8_9LAMI|nr:unnamed protein product [Fraxinus pennsylvanica]
MRESRRFSVHLALGGGAVSDVLLWKKWRGSVSLLVGSTALWFLFEIAGYNILSFISNVLLLLVTILFFWSKSASILNRPLPPLPNLEVSEEIAIKTADAMRVWLTEIVNQGKLVSDEIIISLLSKRLETGEAKGESGFILDGFPRTVRQAEILDDVTDIDLVVNLKLPEKVLVEKCLGRRICSQCGKNFNVANINVKGENGNPDISMDPLLPPPQCVSKLITRSDDTETIVSERLRVYYEKSQPVEDFYRNQGKMMEFNLPGGLLESWPKLLEALNLDENEDKQSAAV